MVDADICNGNMDKALGSDGNHMLMTKSAAVPCRGTDGEEVEHRTNDDLHHLVGPSYTITVVKNEGPESHWKLAPTVSTFPSEKGGV